MDEVGSGTSARQSRSGDVTMGGVTAMTGTSAIAPDDAKIELAVEESRRCADVAQQESACV